MDGVLGVLLLLIIIGAIVIVRTGIVPTGRERTVIWHRRRNQPETTNTRPYVPITADIDRMSGHDFEKFVAQLLHSQGFSVQVTSGAGDFGADVIARKRGVSQAIQCKRNAVQNKVSVRAVQEAVAAMPFYECNSAMVVTSGYFTSQAYKYADKVGCALIDRDSLYTWISEFKREQRKDAGRRSRARTHSRAKIQAEELKEGLTDFGDEDIEPYLEKNTVPALRNLAVLLELSRGRDRKAELIKRIASHIKNQRASN